MDGQQSSEGVGKDKGPADRFPTREQMAHGHHRRLQYEEGLRAPLHQGIPTQHQQGIFDQHQRDLHAAQQQQQRAILTQQQLTLLAQRNQEAVLVQQRQNILAQHQHDLIQQQQAALVQHNQNAIHAQQVSQQYSAAGRHPYVWQPENQFHLQPQGSIIPVVHIPVLISDGSQFIPQLSGITQAPDVSWTRRQVPLNPDVTTAAQPLSRRPNSMLDLCNRQSQSPQSFVVQQNQLDQSSLYSSEVSTVAAPDQNSSQAPSSVNHGTFRASSHTAGGSCQLKNLPAATSTRATEASKVCSSSSGGMSVPEYVEKHCDGSLAKWFTFFYGDRVLIGKTKGCKLLCKAYRYVIKKYKEGKSWGGKFTANDMVTDGKNFRIAIEPEEEATVDNLFLDLGKLTDNMVSHFVVDDACAIYVRHLNDFCKFPPERVKTSEELLEVYLMFLSYHPAFGYSMERADLIKDTGMLYKNCSSDHVTLADKCLQKALSFSFGSGNDWRDTVHTDKLMAETLWRGASYEERRDKAYRYEGTSKGLMVCCRNSLVHTPGHTLLKVTVKQVWKAKQPNQQSQDTFQNSQRPTTQPSQLVDKNIQPMASPREAEYAVGLNFDVYIADSIFNLLSEPGLNNCKYLHDRWAAFKRSVDAEGDDEE
ncbi:hypothetical protein EJB05_23714 [Eragrostis curvula]|uniref:Uncharacterized protein n=1 Tax=Eragrostis curvula TaxID=38414 RepID=A0A5J9V8R5_9POAL|nr:hypothetical protein EJB05_23714 [Eragrostis curvula]